jgi:hypothetical protein
MGMDFAAASESLDGGVHVVSVIFEITQLDQLFEFYPSRAAALNGDGAGRRRGGTAPEGTTRGRKAGRAADLTSANSNDGGPIHDGSDPRLGEPSL